MLWPLVLPFWITFFALAALVLAMTLAAPWMRSKRSVVFAFSAGLSAVAFIPSCTGVMELIDRHRFGVFKYDTADQIGDFRVMRYLPAEATSIVVEKRAMGHKAQFDIKKPALDAWLDKLWKEHGERSILERSPGIPVNERNVALFDDRFRDLGWNCPPDAVEYKSPTAPNGAGFNLWYSESTGQGYLDAWYW